jgi:hypothetical protein
MALMNSAAHVAVLSVCLVGMLGGASAQTTVSETKEDRLAVPSTDEKHVGRAAVTGALLSAGLVTGLEILESRGNGRELSSEDLFVSAASTGFSFLRSGIPQLQDTIDVRIEDIPAGDIGIRQFRSGNPDQKLLLALKLASFDAFENTSLRFVELQAGYFTRGGSDEELGAGGGKSRDPFIGIGINLSDLLHSYEELE